jgi:hypothetical protein
LVNSTPQTYGFTLNYNVGVTTATASQYSWLCSVNGGSFNTIDVCTSPSNSVTKGGVSFPVSTPTTYLVRGTVSHQSSTIGLDTAGSPTPLPVANQAGIKLSTCVGFSAIFPYYFGTVSDACTSINAADIITYGTRCLAQTANGIIVDFNTQNAQTKGFLATPKSPGLGNQNVVTYCRHEEQANPLNGDYIPGPLFATISTVTGVDVCGVFQTYSVYLFSQGSATTDSFKFISP